MRMSLIQTVEGLQFSQKKEFCLTTITQKSCLSFQPADLLQRFQNHVGNLLISTYYLAIICVRVCVFYSGSISLKTLNDTKTSILLIMISNFQYTFNRLQFTIIFTFVNINQNVQSSELSISFKSFCIYTCLQHLFTNKSYQILFGA